jgi:iron complex outermembrane receptor protein
VEDVQVSGTTPSTLTTPTPAGSRLGLTALETPASVAVVSGDLVRELGTSTLIVAKSLAPGITSSAPMGSGGNLLNARGFTGTNSVKQLYNGMEIYNAGGVVSYPFDPWNVDHIGVLYGPASVLYGSGAIGGAVNVVARRPDPLLRRNEVLIEGGSFNTYRFAFDTTGPISERVSYRFDLSTINSEHWVERGDADSLAISGSLRFDLSEKLRFTLSNDFGNQNPSKYLGTPVLNNRPVAGLERTNYNVLDAALNFTDNWTNLETIWTPSPSLSVHNNTYVMYHDRIYRDAPTYAYVPATNQVRRTQFRDIADTYETQFGNTGYVQYSGRLFGLRNDVLAGLDFNRNYYHRNDNVRGGTSLVAAIDPNVGSYLDFYSEQSKPFYRIDVNQVGGFAETRLHATDALAVVAGVRQDHYKVDRYDEIVLATTKSEHDSTGWNVGAVYSLPRGVAVYAQYAEATDPVNSFSSINANQQRFNLSPGRQQEVGVKQSIASGRGEWTFAAYRLVKEDLLTPSVVNPSLTEQVGQQSSRGVEASLALRAGPVRVNLNGTVLDAKFDDFWASVGGVAVSLAGRVPVNVPEESANVVALWDATPFLTPRLVMRYVGRRFADNTNSVASRIPSYTVLDLGTRWRLSPKLSLDLRVDNVTDEVYADSGSSTAWLLGRPRSFAISANIFFP